MVRGAWGVVRGCVMCFAAALPCLRVRTVAGMTRETYICLPT